MSFQYRTNEKPHALTGPELAYEITFGVVGLVIVLGLLFTCLSLSDSLSMKFHKKKLL